MKKILISIMSVVCLLIVSNTVVTASEAETPMTEYVRNGVSYQMYSVAMEKCVPSYNQYLEQISEKLFGVKPLVYGYVIEPRMQSLYGFQKDFSDGSKAIYINVLISFEKGVQVYIHEMVHYMYDFPGSIMYEKNSNGSYKYKQLMEGLTDAIAKEKYAIISNKEYQVANFSAVLEEVLQKDENNILISLYKGDINVYSDKIAESVVKLNEAIKQENICVALEALGELVAEVEKYTPPLFVT